MNTLLGELGTYNDIQYPRYRFAFKLRKLQTTFILHHLELGVLQDVLHSTGIQPLAADDEMTEAQISSLLAEVYASLKSSLQGHVSSAQLQDAHTTCFNWLLLAFQNDYENKATVGRMKIALTMFCGSKTSDKAKYMFGVLARNGTVGKDGLQFFCETVQIMADCLHEVVYPDIFSVDRAMSESLYLVRDKDDIEDEEIDGGLQRPWLSVFELSRVFTAKPPVNFLSWLDLWYHLPQMEKTMHNVKCSICNKKSIVGFRYQCNECSNYHMCQMCFLKGRSSEPHKLEHQVLECESYSKGLKGILSRNHKSKDSRIMDDSREPPTVRYRRDFPDGSANSLNRLSFVDNPIPMSHIRSPTSTPEPIHRPKVIYIGSKDSLSSPRREAIHTNRLSFTSSTSSDSGDGHITEGSISPTGGTSLGIGDSGLRKPSPVIPSLRRNTPDSGYVVHRSLQRIAKESGTPLRKTSTPTYPKPHKFIPVTKTSSDGRLLDDEFTKLNQKLGLEVDMLLRDIEPDISPEPRKSLSSPEDELQAILDIEKEEAMFYSLMSQEEEQKQKLSNDVDSFLGQIQQMHTNFMTIKRGDRISPIPHQIIDSNSHKRTASLDLLQMHSHSSSPNHLSQPYNIPSIRTSVIW